MPASSTPEGRVAHDEGRRGDHRPPFQVPEREKPPHNSFRLTSPDIQPDQRAPSKLGTLARREARDTLPIDMSSTRLPPRIAQPWALLAVSVSVVVPLAACGGSAASPDSVCPPSATCLPSGDGSTDADDAAPLVEAGADDSNADGLADAPASCPNSRPPAGMSCVGASVCNYVSPFGTSTASCVGGVWKLDPPPCPGGPNIEPQDGSACTSEGLSCGWPNACGDDDVGVCTGGAWQMRRPACVQPCPFVEPAPGAGCAPTGVVCSWLNDCGGMDEAACLDFRDAGLQPAWNVGSRCGCPAQPPSGPCTHDLQACRYRDHCDRSSTRSCQGGYWREAESYYQPCNCPAAPPTPGKPCPPNDPLKYLNCRYLTADLCTETWSCVAGGTWPAKPDGPPSCLTPVTHCPDSGLHCSPATQGLRCGYTAGCGRVQYEMCAGLDLIDLSFGLPACLPGCPDAKPQTGSPCAGPSTSICQYVTDIANQCLTNCVCADDGTWGCTPPTCTAPSG